MELLKFWKIVGFLKIPIKKKNCKTFYEAQVESRVKEIIQPPPQIPPSQIKSYYVFGGKKFLTEIHRNIQTFSKFFKNAVFGRQEIVQYKCFFWQQIETCLLKKWETFLAVLRKHVIFNVKWTEVCKMREDFWAKLYFKLTFW